jgi:hypothetical protein
VPREFGRYNPETGKVEWFKDEPKAAARLEIIEDSLPPGGMWHPATGVHVHSKSKFRQMTKAAGCIEVGNEIQKDRRNWELPGAREAVIETIERFKAR